MPRQLVLIVARPYDGEVLRRAVMEAGFEAVAVDVRGAPNERVEELRPTLVLVSLRRMAADGQAIVSAVRAGDHGAVVPVLVLGDPGSPAFEGAALVLRSAEPAALVEAVRSLAGDPAPSELHDDGEVTPLHDVPAAAIRAAREGPVVAGVVNPSSARPRITASHLVVPRRRRIAEEQATESPSVEEDDEVLAPPASTALPRAGDLRLMDLPHLLQQAHLEGFTGRLTLTRDEAVKTIYFDSGDPVFALSNQAHDRLGDLLHREGKITWEQHVACQQEVAHTSRKMGAVLVDMGLIKPRELFPLVRRQVTEIIHSLCSWTDGSYELISGEPLPEEKIKLDARPAALLMEGIRRKYGLERLIELVGPAETRLTVHGAGLARLAQAELLEAERQIVERMDGERTLQQIIELTPLGALGVYQVAYGTIVLGATIARGVGEMMVYGSDTVAAAQRRELAIDRQRIEAKHAQVREGDYFALLGLRPDASAHEVRRAYERTREDFAPTAFAAEVASELGAQLAEICEVVNEAMRVLGDDKLREAYRASIR